MEVENIQNSRALIPVSVEANDEAALTLIHFLNGSSNRIRPPVEFGESDLVLRMN